MVQQKPHCSYSEAQWNTNKNIRSKRKKTEKKDKSKKIHQIFSLKKLFVIAKY